MEKASNDTERAVWVQAYCSALSGILARGPDNRPSSFEDISSAAQLHADTALKRYRELE